MLPNFVDYSSPLIGYIFFLISRVDFRFQFNITRYTSFGVLSIYFVRCAALLYLITLTSSSSSPFPPLGPEIHAFDVTHCERCGLLLLLLLLLTCCWLNSDVITVRCWFHVNKISNTLITMFTQWQWYYWTKPVSRWWWPWRRAGSPPYRSIRELQAHLI